jgi:hypothetical protein
VAPNPPSVFLQLSDSRIESGDTITVTLYGADDEGLDWIAWEGVNAGERALDRENRFECGGKTTCLQSWTVRVSTVGSHTIQGRSRDVNGQKSDPVFAELRVRPAATPTRVATATPTRTTSQAALRP